MAHREQAGARWIAHERPVLEPVISDEPPVFAPEGEPLIERLSLESLAALASVSGETVAELIERNS